MTSPAGRDLGSATGRIVIDVSSLREAGTIAQQVAKEINAAFSQINGNLSNVAQIARAWSQAQSAQYRAAAAEAQANAKAEVSASNERIQALKSETQIYVQQSKERIAAMKQEQQEQRQTRGGAGGTGGGAGQAYRFPTFIQFAAYPAGQLLNAFGAQGAGNAVMTGGAVAGLIDQLPILGLQAQTLAGRLTGLGGVLGTLATFGSNLLAPLGATAAGFGAILAVAAPLVLVLGGVAAIMGEVQRQAQLVNDALTKQQQINEQLAGGATSQDLQEGQQQARRTLGADQETLSRFQDLFARYQNYQLSQAGANDIGAIALGQPVSPELMGLRKEFSDLMGGATDNINLLGSAIDQQSERVAKDTVALGLYNAALGSNTVQVNNAIAGANKQAAASVEEVKLRQQLANSSTEQLQTLKSNVEQEFSAILEAQKTAQGKQYEIFTERAAQLGTEYRVIQELIAGAKIRDLEQFAEKFNDLNDAFQRQNQRTQEDRAIQANDAMYDRIIARAREVEDFVRQRANQIADFDKSQRRAEEDYQDARAKAIEDYQKAAEEAEQEHQDRLAKIIADARIGILEAAARLDARGVFEQQRRRDQQIRDENENARKDKEKRDEQFQEQLEDQEAQYEKQRQRRIEDFNEQLSRADQERAIRAAREEQDYALQQYRQQRNFQTQDQRRLEDFNYQAQQLAQHYNIMQGITQAGVNTIQFLWSALFSGMIGAMPGGGSGSGGAGYPGSGQTIGTFDNGGINMRPGWFYSGVPEAHIPLSQLGGGATRTIEVNFNGDLGNYSLSQLSDVFRAVMRDGGLDEGLRAFFNQHATRRLA